jgi:hypothetical protein
MLLPITARNIPMKKAPGKTFLDKRLLQKRPHKKKSWENKVPDEKRFLYIKLA